MLTPKGWIALAVGGVLLAQTAGLMVQGRQLQRERAEVSRLEGELRSAEQAAVDLRAAVSRAETQGAIQAQEEAILCQGDAAEMFNRGRQVGIVMAYMYLTNPPHQVG